MLAAYDNTAPTAKYPVGVSRPTFVRCASTENVDTTSQVDTVDGVTLVAGDAVLLKDQTDGKKNGVWIRDGAQPVLRVPVSGETGYLMIESQYFTAREGTTNKGKVWSISGTAAPIVINTTTQTLTLLKTHGAAQAHA